MQSTGIKAPNTYLVIGALIIVMAALTWIVPGGEFEKQEVDGKQRVIPNTFEFKDRNPQGIGAILGAPFEGFVEAADIIVFVLIVGGAFYVLQGTKAIDAGILAVARAHERSRTVRLLLIPIFMVIFSLGGSVYGMAEETIPFVLIFIPLALALGYDSIVGIAIPFVGAGAGFAGAFINPFTLGIAQGISGLPPLSGLGYRVLVWIITTSVATIFIMRYAARVKKNPRLSPCYETDQAKRSNLDMSELESFSGISNRHKLVLVGFGLAMGLLVFGVLQYGWYIKEIAALFLASGIIIGVVGGLKASQIVDNFSRGAKDLLDTALLIGLARGILVIARDGHIIDTLLNFFASLIDGLPAVAAAWIMFFTQTAINFFVPSGSGQAALTMPIMAPLADLVGVSRQTAVLAYQFGDGFSNLIIPTSGILVGILALAGISWTKWARWMLPLQLILLGVGMMLLIPPFVFDWADWARLWTP